MFQPQPTPLVVATTAITAAVPDFPPDTYNSSFTSLKSGSTYPTLPLDSHLLEPTAGPSSGLSTYQPCGLPTSCSCHTSTTPSTTIQKNNSINDDFLARLNPVELSILGFNSGSLPACETPVNIVNDTAISAAGSAHHTERRFTAPYLYSANDTVRYRGAIRRLAKLPITKVIGYRAGIGHGSKLAYTTNNIKTSTNVLRSAPSNSPCSLPVSHIPTRPGHIQSWQPTWINPDPLRFQTPQPLPRLVKMEDPGLHSMAAQEAAARAYEPDLEGPLVGNRQSSEAITQQYAKADPIYVEKTMLLPQTYSHYRPIQGDGNCGWRAIGFLYCEKLIELGDGARVRSEAERHDGMKSALDDGSGFLEDFVDAMVNLLDAIADTMHDPSAAHKMLLERFNDVELANPLIYYLRLLAAHYLKTNAAEYDAFVIGTGQGSSVAEFCQRNIEPVNLEIEQMGITALTNILLKPVDIVLEIAYLDRSPGNQTNTYRYPDDAKGRGLLPHESLICLLYRPDHYDVLYRAESYRAPAPAAPITLQVHRVGGISDNANIAPTHGSLGTFATSDFSTLAMIPGIGPMGSPPPMNTTMSARSLGGPYAAAQSSQSPWVSTHKNDITVSPCQPSIAAPAPSSFPALAVKPPNQGNIHPADLDKSKSVHPVRRHESPSPLNSEYTIRFSPLQYRCRKGLCTEPTFQVKTNAFKNSIYNRAHFGNPDFHPEEYTPEQRRGRNEFNAGRRTERTF